MTRAPFSSENDLLSGGSPVSAAVFSDRSDTPAAESFFGAASYFVPGHITGFFEIADNADPHLKGSRGCGIVPDKGLTTTVRSLPAENEAEPFPVDVFLNGRPVPGRIVKSVLSLMDLPKDRPYRLEVFGKADLPVGCGFGMSAAGALGTAFAANALFGLNYSRAELVEFAHVAEVMNGSGLGDVAGCSSGGLVLRERPGGSLNGVFRRLDAPPKKLFCLVLGPLDTSSVLSDPGRAERIRVAGREAMSAFLKKPSFWSFMEQSLVFSKSVGLMSDDARAAVSALDPSLAKASQAMLGNTVFAVTADFSETDDPEQIAARERKAERHIEETLGRYGDVIVCRIGFLTPVPVAGSVSVTASVSGNDSASAKPPYL